jgi:hypothetical protein
MAANQRGFRPRPLDVQKTLTIITDLSQLESTDGVVSRDITHNHEALDKENEEVPRSISNVSIHINTARMLAYPDYISTMKMSTGSTQREPVGLFKCCR